jgi:hypothetical protein
MIDYLNDDNVDHFNVICSRCQGRTDGNYSVYNNEPVCRECHTEDEEYDRYVIAHQFEYGHIPGEGPSDCECMPDDSE